MLTGTADLWTASIEEFRRCGQARKECVVYWIGPASEKAMVDEMVHPRHSASVGHYELDPAWLNEFWLGLSRAKKSVRLQAHTHAGSAFHSATDDQWPIVHTPGFLSLVIPFFAERPFRIADPFLAKIGEDGIWRRAKIEAHLSGIP